MEKKIRITIRCGKSWKEVSFPVPGELEADLLELLKVEDAMTGSPFHAAGNKSIQVRIETFNFEKEF